MLKARMMAVSITDSIYVGIKMARLKHFFFFPSLFSIKWSNSGWTIVELGIYFTQYEFGFFVGRNNE